MATKRPGKQVSWPHWPHGGYKFFAQGRYVDQLVKQRGQWLIAHRRVDLDPLASDPEKIVGLSDPDVAPLFQPLIDAWARLGEKV